VILVDSTVWIDLLRAGSGKPVVRLRDLLDNGEAAVAPVIVQEILQGAASPQSLERLRAHFLALPMLVPTDLAATHAAAGALFARCRWQGITPRSPHDCLIAQVAVEHGVTLLHDDKDFDQIARSRARPDALEGLGPSR
jgi:predicted nucleic acid-binding protein